MATVLPSTYTGSEYTAGRLRALCVFTDGRTRLHVKHQQLQ